MNRNSRQATGDAPPPPPPTQQQQSQYGNYMGYPQQQLQNVPSGQQQAQQQQQQQQSQAQQYQQYYAQQQQQYYNQQQAAQSQSVQASAQPYYYNGVYYNQQQPQGYQQYNYNANANTQYANSAHNNSTGNLHSTLTNPINNANNNANNPPPPPPGPPPPNNNNNNNRSGNNSGNNSHNNSTNNLHAGMALVGKGGSNTSLGKNSTGSQNSGNMNTQNAQSQAQHQPQNSQQAQQQMAQQWYAQNGYYTPQQQQEMANYMAWYQQYWASQAQLSQPNDPNTANNSVSNTGANTSNPNTGNNNASQSASYSLAAPPQQFAQAVGYYQNQYPYSYGQYYDPNYYNQYYMQHAQQQQQQHAQHQQSQSQYPTNTLQQHSIQNSSDQKENMDYTTTMQQQYYAQQGSAGYNSYQSLPGPPPIQQASPMSQPLSSPMSQQNGIMGNGSAMNSASNLNLNSQMANGTILQQPQAQQQQGQQYQGQGQQQQQQQQQNNSDMSTNNLGTNRSGNDSPSGGSKKKRKDKHKSKRHKDGHRHKSSKRKHGDRKHKHRSHRDKSGGGGGGGGGDNTDDDYKDDEPSRDSQSRHSTSKHRSSNNYNSKRKSGKIPPPPGGALPINNNEQSNTNTNTTQQTTKVNDDGGGANGAIDSDMSSESEDINHTIKQPAVTNPKNNTKMKPLPPSTLGVNNSNLTPTLQVNDPNSNNSNSSSNGSSNNVANSYHKSRKQNLSRFDSKNNPLRKRGPVSSGIPLSLQNKLQNNEVFVSSHLKLISSKNCNKKEGTVQFLKDCLLKEALFAGMSNEMIDDIINVMYKVECKPNQVIIEQGEYGDTYFIVESGKFDILYKETENMAAIRIGEMAAGKAFGEGSLLYSVPRSATLKATLFSVVWALDATKFMEIRQKVSQALHDKSNKVIKFLKTKVKLFNDYHAQDLIEVSAAMTEKKFKKNDIIVQQGDDAHEFFVIRAGTAVAIIKRANGDEEKVKEYKEGDYFGERGLHLDTKRAASIVATSSVKCYVVSKDDFINLMAQNSGADFDMNLKQYDAVAFEKGLHQKFRNKIDCTLKQFLDLGILGVGSFGRVSLVKDPNTNATYSLKKVRKNKVIDTGQQDHVKNERMVLAMIDSNFCCKLFATFQDTLNIYFLMEAVLGGELFTVLRWNKRFSERTARFYASCVVLAFEHLHSKNIIYRDLKPENLLISENGYCKLVDFGFAKRRNNSCTLCGTPEYLSPEVIQNFSQGFAVDWWALGIFIFEMVIGNAPFQDDPNVKMYEKILGYDVEFPEHPQLTNRVTDLINRLLEKEAYKRLGAGKNGAKHVKSHPWFTGLDWDKMAAMEIPPPYKPLIKNNEDVSNYDNYPDEDIEEDLRNDPDGTLYAWCDDF